MISNSESYLSSSTGIEDLSGMATMGTFRRATIGFSDNTKIETDKFGRATIPIEDLSSKAKIKTDLFNRATIKIESLSSGMCFATCPEGTVTEMDNCIFDNDLCTGDTWCFDDSGIMTPISCGTPETGLCIATCPEGTVTEMDNCIFDNDLCTGDTWCFDGSGIMTPVSCSDCEGVVDECGVCNGEGIPEENCDCNGNVNDQCGICGGDNNCCTDPEAINYLYEGICIESGKIIMDLHSGANLVSFPLSEIIFVPPSNFTLGFFPLHSIFDTEVYGPVFYAVIEAALAAMYDGGGWIGSLTVINPDSGYWLKVTEYINDFTVEGTPRNYYEPYSINVGANLISFPGINVPVPVGKALSNGEGILYAIIGEGSAAVYDTNQEAWIGSLTHLSPGRGYWIKSNMNFELVFGDENSSTSSTFIYQDIDFEMGPDTNINELSTFLEEELLD